MATEAQTTRYAIRKLVLRKESIGLSAFILSRVEVVEGSHKKPLFMQNKPKFQKARMNANTVVTKDYDNWTLGERGKNKANTNPKQTQTNPKQAQNEPKTNPISKARTALLASAAAKFTSKKDFSNYFLDMVAQICYFYAQFFNRLLFIFGTS